MTAGTRTTGRVSPRPSLRLGRRWPSAKRGRGPTTRKAPTTTARSVSRRLLGTSTARASDASTPPPISKLKLLSESSRRPPTKPAPVVAGESVTTSWEDLLCRPVAARSQDASDLLTAVGGVAPITTDGPEAAVPSSPASAQYLGIATPPRASGHGSTVEAQRTAGSGRATSPTAMAVSGTRAAWCWLIGWLSSSWSGRSPKGSRSTTFVETGPAATRCILSPSPRLRTRVVEMEATEASGNGSRRIASAGTSSRPRTPTAGATELDSVGPAVRSRTGRGAARRNGFPRCLP